mgnify:CR=1 FL=1
MIRTAFYIIFLFNSMYSYSQNLNEVCTSIFLIRHAEKVRDNSGDKNPHLNSDGVLRANKWRDVLKHIKFDRIYSTNLYRTLETAFPISKYNQLEIQTYLPSKGYYNQFLELNKGKTILVVGHSNTTPEFVNSLIKNNFYKDISDDNNGNLYYVQKCNNNKPNHLLFYIN